MYIDLTLMCKKLQNLRIESGITQAEMAHMSNYSQQTISAFENGLTNNALLLIAYISIIPKAIDIFKDGEIYGITN